MVALLWLLAMLAGIDRFSPARCCGQFRSWSALALFNLLLNRVIFAWLSRWMAQRRTREILGALFILVMFSFQLIGP